MPSFGNNGVVPYGGENYSQVETLTHQLNIDKKDFLYLLGFMRKYTKNFELRDKFEKQYRNNNKAGGYAFYVSKMTLLERFLVVGYENYCKDSGETNIENENKKDDEEKRNKKREEIMDLVKSLIKEGCYLEVLDKIEKLSMGGRVIKADSILFVLSILATDENMEVRQAAYGKVNDICNIPTKLFRFIQLSQHCKAKDRMKNPQKYQEEKKKTVDTKKKPEEHDEGSEKDLNFDRLGNHWGRLRRNAIKQFYIDEEKGPMRLLYLLTKYKKRHQWSHVKVAKYAHPKMDDNAKALVLKYCIKGYKAVEEEIETLEENDASLNEVKKFIKIINEVRCLKYANGNDKRRLLEILEDYGVQENDNGSEINETQENAIVQEREIKIVREHIPTEFLGDVEVWEALLKYMPMTAMIRNLKKMASLGMFDMIKRESAEKNIKNVVKALGDEDRLRNACIHPMKIHIAKTKLKDCKDLCIEGYKEGQEGNFCIGEENNEKSNVDHSIIDALDSAFYKCFQTLKRCRTDRKFMLFLDIQSLKGGDEFRKFAAVTMIMTIWNVEEHVEIIGYNSEIDECIDLKRGLQKTMTIDDAIEALELNVHEDVGVDAGQQDEMKKVVPIKYAFNKRIEVDCFIVFTCSGTDHVDIPHVIVLKMYNHTMQRNAKLIVCEMSDSTFSIGDPRDPNCLDINGFDSHTPEIIQRFARN